MYRLAALAALLCIAAPLSAQQSAHDSVRTRRHSASAAAKKSTHKTTASKSAASASAVKKKSAASSSSSRPTAAPAAGSGSTVTDETRVNDFLSYDASKKTVTLRVFAAYGSNNGGMNFNGGARGDQTITIPVGWTVTAHVLNKDAIPHSAIVIADVTPLPVIPDEPAIPRAYTAHLTDGLAPQDGADDMTFKASKAGSFVLVCGVPGHGPSGMWIHLVVSPDATVPAYKI